jgi:hypothetical protein
MKNAFQLVSVVVIGQMSMILIMFISCFALAFADKQFKGSRCDGSKATELLSLITVQCFALLAAERGGRN